VLATKNGMPYVREAVASLEAQTLHDYEVVVQDTTSTDGTAEFLSQLRLSNVRVASERDSGLGEAYNRAFPRCRGEIVGILDSDNLLAPDALEAVDALFLMHRTAVAIYGAVTMIDSAGQQVGSFVPEAFDQRALMRCELVPPFSSSFFHRQRCGPELRCDASLAACQDFELWLRLSDREIVRSTTVLGATRFSHKSMSRNAENYEHFCAQKIVGLERFIADRPRLQPERNAAVAGIYCWAAESILEIDGPGPRFESFVHRAAALRPEYDRLQRVRDRASDACHTAGTVKPADPRPARSAPIQRLALDSPAVSQGAAFEPLGNRGARIVTGTAPWQHAVGLRLGPAEAASGVLALVACRRGEVGVAVLAEDGSTHVSPEGMVLDGETRLVSALVDRDGEPARWLVIRNGAGDGASECDLLAVFPGSVPRVELTDEDVALALRDPVAARAGCTMRAWPEDVIAAVGATGVPLRVDRRPAPLRLPPPRALWSGAVDTAVHDAAQDLVELLDEFQPDALEQHVAVLPKDSMRSYLRMSVVRVVRLVELLRRRGFEGGEVLEVGAWLGSFSLALRRLGYDVLACDRYSSYGAAFDSNIELMRAEGIRVVSTNRESELEQIAALGRFDIVLAGAVIEHVPHTPRHFLETLYGAVRPGGTLILDTPNVARYWNRRALEGGETIFQPIEDQFLSEPPWEGHHREYTAYELRWMLERIGCEDVDVEFLDYNMLQFEELSAEHIGCLATIVEDPSQSDTLLAAGRRPVK
jgi:2-polyprenyl-3-methyl-5-hydroxy-6-metoxy-1,4-benzoquinol methylase